MPGNVAAVKATDGHRRVRLAAVIAVLFGVILLHSPMCVAAGAHQPHDIPEPGGTLVTCLVLIVSVLVAVAGLRVPRRRVAVRRLCSSGIMSLGAVWMRPPRLAELCVLRI